MKAQNRHITIVTPGFPINEKDTTCIPALQIFVKKLKDEAGIKVSVIAVHYPFKKTNYRWYNCSVYSLGIQNKKRNRLKSYINQWKVLKRIHKDEPIDVIHSFWLGECAMIGHYFSKKHRIKHITTLMGQDARKGNKYAAILPLKSMKLISLSKFHQNEVKKSYALETSIIPWGIEAISNKDLIEKTIDVIGIGSLISLKNYTAFIQTIHLLKQKYPTIKAVIIGDGLLKEKLLSEIKELQLEQNIDLKGTVSYAETQHYLSQSKVLLHPSNYESYGMVFTEAIANKTAIVSRKVGFAESAEHWFLGNSPEEFSEGCFSFINKKQVIFPDYHSIEDTLLSYLDLYSDK